MKKFQVPLESYMQSIKKNLIIVKRYTFLGCLELIGIRIWMQLLIKQSNFVMKFKLFDFLVWKDINET